MWWSLLLVLFIFLIIGFVVGLVLFIIQLCLNRQARLDGKIENRSYKLYIPATILMVLPIIGFLILLIFAILNM